MDLSKPSTRWAIVGIVAVAIMLGGLGIYASRQAASAAVYCGTLAAKIADSRCNGATRDASGFVAVRNSSLLNSDHAWGFFLAALILGLLALWAVSAGKRGRAEAAQG